MCLSQYLEHSKHSINGSSAIVIIIIITYLSQEIPTQPFFNPISTLMLLQNSVSLTEMTARLNLSNCQVFFRPSL